MKDETTRRDFLRSAGMAAAAIVGAGVLARSGYSQDQDEEKKKEEPKEEEPNWDELFEEDSSGDEDTRACPQCGALMYRQGRTWTCENCGYSYVE